MAALAGRSRHAASLSNLSVVLAAYSGGYMPASAILQARGAERVKGVLLFDALYGEIDTFADWIARQRSQSFFFSAYSASTKAQNLDLENRLAEKGIAAHQQLPQHFAPGEIAFWPRAIRSCIMISCRRPWTRKSLERRCRQAPRCHLSWREFWNEPHSIYVSARHRLLHYDRIAKGHSSAHSVARYRRAGLWMR